MTAWLLLLAMTARDVSLLVACLRRDSPLELETLTELETLKLCPHDFNFDGRKKGT